MRLAEIMTLLQKSAPRILMLPDLKKLLRIKKDNTAYKVVEKLVRQQILVRLKKGLYLSSYAAPHEFEQANYLYSPSYVSLESALNSYGILSQFPYTITSISPKKSKKITAIQKEFEYVHLSDELFWGYEKQDHFLIALPEKALIDAVYLASKGIRTLPFDELDYSRINFKTLENYRKKIKYSPFQHYYEKLKLKKKK